MEKMCSGGEKMGKKCVAALLALLMCLTLLPVASAAETDFVIDEEGVLTAYNGPGGDVVIPNEVIKIGNGAFYGCATLTSITIPDSVISVGDSAFFRCFNLTSVTLPDGVISIGCDVFNQCKDLASVTIGDGMTSIGDGAFYACASLAGITIPAGVTNIGNGAFGFCSDLAKITVAPDNPNYADEDGILFTKSKDTLMAYPAKRRETSYMIPASVTSIGSFAFSSNCNLISITIPASVTSIGDSEFSYCSGLTKITVAPDNPNYVDADGVLYTKSMNTLIAYPVKKAETSYTIPDSVTSISNSAFSGCANLTNVTIPNSVAQIGIEAFYNCVSLTSVVIPEGVTDIWQATFSGCTSLTNVTIPDSITSIMDSAFRNCTNLTGVTIPDGVNSIGWSVFYGCDNVTVYGKAGSYAEQYCKENEIPFIAGAMPGTAQAGRFENGPEWWITAEGEVSVTFSDTAQEETVLVGCYGSDGRFIGFKWINAQDNTAQIDPTAPSVRFFWLNDKQSPLSPCVTAWGR